MDMGLEGKVALVTAASKGIGRAIALELADEGAKVAISGRNEETLKTAAGMIKKATGQEVATYCMDLTSESDVKKLIDDVENDLGGIWTLVNSSAGPPTKPFEELSDADWKEALDIKFLAQMRPSREAMPRMKKTQGRAYYQHYR